MTRDSDKSIISIISKSILKVEDGWFEGTLNGKLGVFPSNYVEKIIIDSQQFNNSTNLPNNVLIENQNDGNFILF